MLSKRKIPKKIFDLRIFLLESPNPADLLLNRSECHSLEKICELYGYKFSSFFIKSRKDFQDTISFISSYDINHDDCNKDNTVVSLHLSMHGNDKCIGLGNENVSWSEVAKDLKPLFKIDFPLPIFIVLSCCYSGNQKITNEIIKMVTTELEDELIIPPAYLFVNNASEVVWADAVLAWSIFYRQIVKCAIDNKYSFQNMINMIEKSEFASLKYFRWDEKTLKYLSYSKSASKS